VFEVDAEALFATILLHEITATSIANEWNQSSRIAHRCNFDLDDFRTEFRH
jgi:hypothetical protein